MGNVRDLIRLTDDEIRAYVESSMTAIVGTINHDGWPHVVPMWYAVIDGLIHMHTYKASQKVRNLERDPRGSILIEDGVRYNELRGVFMRGRFDVIDDQDLCYRIGILAAAKYMDSDEEQAGPFVRHQVRKRVALVFHPEKISSWDHRKLP
ncbi:MAG: PPOX class F420-dependent oxidoreductase [Candidatus Dadabacteria bacterium]|nr:MAG: PPOX class F420-dependent oxidoreductase [Candidatus Dadabacteria bacterium]